MNSDNPNPYADIIDLPHHVSTRHPQMPMEKRAAQFSPFAALTGHKEAILETASLTKAKVELDEYTKALLDAKFQELQDDRETPQEAFTWFQPDNKKDGGSYTVYNVMMAKNTLMTLKKIEEEKMNG